FRLPRLYPVAETFGVSFVVRRLRDVLGDAVVQLAAVRLAFPAPTLTRVYDDFFGVAVQFGQESYDVTFSRQMPEAPLLTGNPELARTLAEQTRPAIAPPRGDAFVERVRTAIAQCLAEAAPTVSTAAITERLGITSRSLQRKLREQNTSLSAL